MASQQADGSKDGDDAQTGGSQCSRSYCHRDSQTKLGWKDTDDDDPFASHVEAGLEEDEAVMEDE